LTDTATRKKGRYDPPRNKRMKKGFVAASFAAYSIVSVLIRPWFGGE